MISTDLLRVSICLVSTHRRHPDTLSSLVPLFAGVVAMTQRDLITYLLNMEADWPRATTHTEWFRLTRDLIQSVIADMDLDPDSLSQVEEAFISAGLL